MQARVSIPGRVLLLSAFQPLIAAVRISRESNDQSLPAVVEEAIAGRNGTGAKPCRHSLAWIFLRERHGGCAQHGLIEHFDRAAVQHQGIRRSMETWVDALEDPGISASGGHERGNATATQAEQRLWLTPTAQNPQMLSGLQQMLMALGGGVGVVMQQAMIPFLREEYESRSRYQNDALLLLIVVSYFVAIVVSLSYVHWKSHNRSSITYYASPGYIVAGMEGHDVIGFLTTFSQAPKQVLLQVTGFLPVDDSVVEAFEWRGGQYDVAFTFALDLSPWVVREEWGGITGLDSPEGEGHVAPQQPLFGGIAAQELEELRKFLAHDTNDLAAVLLQKQVAWPGWEELATNIRQRIKQCGFQGVLHVQCGSGETVTVYKNKPWANFLYKRTTGVLCMLSMVGWPLYSLYMWWRCTRLQICAQFRVDVSTEDYWGLIADKLSAAGFDINAAGTGGSAY